MTGTPGVEAFLDQAPARPERVWWRRRAGAVLVVVLVVVALAGIALSLGSGPGDPLDPRSAASDGSLAVARILTEQGGVDVRLIAQLDDVVAAATAGTTVFVVDNGLPLPADRLSALAGSGADIVLASPGFVTLLTLAPEVAQTGDDPTASDDPIEPDCADPDAVAAGDITAGGDGYLPVPDGATGAPVVCYPLGSSLAPGAGGYAVVDRADGSRVTLVGNPEILTNAALDQRGNAALALRALGRNPVVLWYLADPFDPSLARDTDEPVDPLSLLPAWVGWVALQLAVAALVVIVWRFRRLGALVPEGLPAVVRSVETAEGRARLYRRGGARDRAATLLRADTARRLAVSLGARRGATRTDIARLYASATGRDPVVVAAVLAGPPPATDASLVTLADELDALAADLRRS